MRHVLLSLVVLGAVLSLWATRSNADDIRHQLQAYANAVVRLAPGPGGYGRDCVWRTAQVRSRIGRRFVTQVELVTWGGGCHSVAGVFVDDEEWLVDGQSGIVEKVRGDWAGPFHIDYCQSAVGWR